MPDFTELVAPVCQSVTAFSVMVEGHRVTYGETLRGRYRYDWECDCNEDTSQGHCSHVKAAMPQRCRWNKYFDPQPIPEGHRCPECGGPLAFVKVAV